MKMFLHLLFAVLTLTTASAQTKPAFLDYTVEYLDQIQIFTSQVTLGDLFDPANSAHATTDDGQTISSQVDKRTLQGTTLTYLLTTKRDKKVALKATLRFLLNEAEDKATMTYIKVTDPSTATFTEAEFNGTINSLGRILGIFSGVARLFIDPDKTNASAAKREEQ